MFVFHRVDGAGGVVSLETIQNAKVIMSGRSVCVCVCVCVFAQGGGGRGGCWSERAQSRREPRLSGAGRLSRVCLSGVTVLTTVSGGPEALLLPDAPDRRRWRRRQRRRRCYDSRGRGTGGER